jgi:hypothetical protein
VPGRYLAIEFDVPIINSLSGSFLLDECSDDLGTICTGADSCLWRIRT